MLTSFLNTPMFLYVGWLSLPLADAEVIVRIALGVLVFAYTGWKWYRDYKKDGKNTG